MREFMVGLVIFIIFVVLNICGIYLGDDPTPDVDGKWNGFTEEEMQEGFNTQTMCLGQNQEE